MIDRTIADLEASIVVLTKDLNAYVNRYREQVEKKVFTLELQVSGLKSELDAARTQVETLKKEVSQLMNERDTARRECEATERYWRAWADPEKQLWAEQCLDRVKKALGLD